jgi:uncharacterized protein (TIGR00299 family) protein
MRTLFLDGVSGISGDMSVGALIDVGADFGAIQAGLDSLGVPDFSVSIEKVKKKGITATKFHVNIDESKKQPHRHLRHVVEIIEKGDLPESVKEAAIQTFKIVAEAEATVHGSTIEAVHFHEVGAIDSIVDIVAAQHAKHLLGIERVVAAPLHVGAGTVKCAHGVLPVPAPATALILKDVPTYGGDVQGELVTPTGAALVVQWTKDFGGAPAMSIESVGYGSGTKDLEDRANVLRATVGEATQASTPKTTESITVIEANLDDMIGELFPPLLTALLEAGARDAFITPVIGKKGRPAHCITVLCDAEQVDPVTRALFANATTLGVRMREEQRIVLDRSFADVETEWGTVRIKIGSRDGVQSTAAPEFEDCRKLAEAAGVPVRQVYEAALGAAAQGGLTDG